MTFVGTLYDLVYFSLHYHALAGALIDAATQHIDSILLLFQNFKHFSHIVVIEILPPLALKAEFVRSCLLRILILLLFDLLSLLLDLSGLPDLLANIIYLKQQTTLRVLPVRTLDLHQKLLLLRQEHVSLVDVDIKSILLMQKLFEFAENSKQSFLDYNVLFFALGKFVLLVVVLLLASLPKLVHHLF